MRAFAVVAVLLLAACASSPEHARPASLAYTVPSVARNRYERPLAPDRAPPQPEAPAPAPAPGHAGDALESPGWSVSLRSFKTTSEQVGQPMQAPPPAPQAPVEPQPEYPRRANLVEPCSERYWYPEHCGREPWVPVNTMVGATIGAAFDAGHHCGHGYHGALVGAGIGFALDLGRLFCH